VGRVYAIWVFLIKKNEANGFVTPILGWQTSSNDVAWVSSAKSFQPSQPLMNGLKSQRANVTMNKAHFGSRF
jgi:hypothetical protein